MWIVPKIKSIKDTIRRLFSELNLYWKTVMPREVKFRQEHEEKSRSLKIDCRGTAWNIYLRTLPPFYEIYFIGNVRVISRRFILRHVTSSNLSHVSLLNKS